MEAPRSVDAGKIQRKPLGDCTNIVSRSSQQSSSSVKYANPSLSFSLKRLVEQATRKETKDVPTSEAPSESDSRSLATNVRPVTRRMSTDLGSPASAPPRSNSSLSDLDVGDKVFAEELCSAYTLRKKRNKDPSSSSAVPRLRRDLTSSSGKKRRQPDENKTKPSKEASKKRQRTIKQEKKDSVHGACQDELEKQKAYFAEIDAFELPVEEVSGSDLD